MASTIGRAVRAASTTAACAALTLGLAAAPTSADPGAASSSARDYKPWGKAYSKDRTLRKGCHTYTFRYRITIPEEGRDDWAAEFFVRKPNGRPLASPVAIVGADRLRGKKPYRVCKPSTRYGSHQIRMKVTWTDDAERDHEGYVRPTRFRFTRP